MSQTRIPPCDLGAEREVIAAVSLFPDAWGIAGDILAPDGSEFYSHQHGVIWAAAAAVAKSGSPVDTLGISGQLQATKADEQCQAALLAASDTLPNMFALEARCQRIKNRSALRAAATAAHALYSEIMGEVEDDAAMLDRAEHVIADAVGGRFDDGEMHSAADVVVECFEALVARCDAAGNDGGPEGHLSGLKDLDDVLSGWCGGKLYIIGGRPGMGKSLIGKEVAVGIAKADLPVVVFSLEMPRREWFDRVVASEADVLYEHWRDAKLDKAENARIAASTNAIAALPISISDKPGVTVEYIARWSRRVQRKQGKIGAILIDYLQLMSSSRKDISREQEISYASRKLKELSKELDCPVIALSQLNRGVENRDNKRPKLSDLRESGSLEQDADAVLLAYRDGYYNPDSPQKGVVEVDVAKQRGGRTGPVSLSWQGHYMRILNLDPRDMPEPPDGREPHWSDNP